MHQKITIALDMMSGDHGLSASVPGAIKSLKEHDDLFLMLIGDEKLILPLIPDDFKDTQKKRYSIIHTTEYIAMWVSANKNWAMLYPRSRGKCWMWC